MIVEAVGGYTWESGRLLIDKNIRPKKGPGEFPIEVSIS